MNHPENDGQLLPMLPWTQIQTEGFLTEFPLPASFMWPDRYGKERSPMPKYRVSGGYGKWLRETPYFPGLFELVHDILVRAPEDAVLTPEWVADRLNEHRRAQAAQTATLL